jgi:CubicO group peptidase (beta-lactamase class C family)
MRPRRLHVTVPAALVLALVASACSDDDPAASGPVAGSTVVTAAPAPTTTSAAVSTAPSTSPSTTASAPTSTSAVATTTPASTAPPDLGESGAYPAQPAGVAWPTDGWSDAPLPAGVDRSVLDAAVDAGFGAVDASGRVRAVVVVHGGAIVYERAHPLDDLDAATPSFSVAKSVTATLTGMLVDDGRLDVHAPAPVPEWQSPGDDRAAITLDQLLRMSSGLAWTEEYSATGLPLQMLRAQHAADVPIEQPLVAEPGVVWNYSTGTSAIIADILADTLGGPAELDEFIDERLLRPLGLTSCQVQRDPSGTYLGGVGFDCSPREYAKLGLLVLRGGVWDDRRIVSEGWIDSTRAPTSGNPAYGAHWWLFDPPGSFRAMGLFGQQIVVVPALDLVVVTTATAGGTSMPVARAIVDEFERAFPG